MWALTDTAERGRGLMHRKRWLASWVGLLSIALIVSVPTSAQAVPQQVTDLYDASVVRDLHIEFEPLPGWRPEGDWLAPEGWTDLPEEQKDAYIAADPTLRPLAVAAAWDTVRFDTTNSIVVKATFHERIDEVNQEPLVVGIRRKSSRALPSEANPQKIGMKVRFSHYVSGQRWRGVNQLSLENGGDISPLHEGMAWQLHQAAGIEGLYGPNYNPALAAWSTVTVNGSPLGVYTSVEQRNKRFLQNRNLWTTGSSWMYEQDDIGMPELDEGPDPLPDGTLLHSPTFESLCFAPFRPKTGEYAATCEAPTDGLLDDVLDSQIAMGGFLTQAAVDAFTTNDDAMMKGKNYHFVDRTDKLRSYYPWDLDAVFRSTTSNIYSSGSATNKRGVTTYTQTPWQTLILNHPTYRARYNDTMLRLLNGPLSNASVDALFARVQPAVSAALAVDPYLHYVVSGSVDDHFRQLRTWISTRDSEIRKQVFANIPAPRKADSIAPTISNLELSAAVVAPGAPVQVSATVADNAEVVGAEVRVASGEWAPLSAVDELFDSSSEAVAGAISAPLSDGTYQVCVRGIDSSGNVGQACVNLSVSAPKDATTLNYTGTTSVKAGASMVLAARLVLATSTTPVSGAQVTFSLAGKNYVTTTGADGVAAVSLRAPTKTGSYPVLVTSAAGATYTSASTSATVSVVK
jgi:hypothetical protein